uniref:VWFD domain-containing protein n=1 Tax=Periophthalmus magnuspinnatus TaxID=409849 RepID=A0A3B4ANL7_9GOBI
QVTLPTSYTDQVWADSYFRGCVHGMCASHGDPEVLCDSLQVYADLCKKAGVDLPVWRNSSFCSLQCGENSHYNSCAEGCPEVCFPLDQVSSCGSCEERCECDPGFKLSGGKCVQAEDCGCWHNGQHHEVVNNKLHSNCLCVGNNNIQCRSSHCSASEVCAVQNGVKGCFAFSPATCSVYGDPHYITFDGFAYDFNGGCSYVLTTTCGGQSSVDFTVTGHNMHPPHNNFSISKLDAVTLEVGDLQITISQSGVYVSIIKIFHWNTLICVCLCKYTKSVRAYVDSGYTVLETTFGLRIMMDKQNRLFLQVNEHFKYELCGLCGTYSGQQDDDLVMPGGQNATTTFQFADSWRVQDSNLPVFLKLDQAYNHCYALLGEGFSLCHETLHPEIYISSCVHDFCATRGNLITLCEALKSYAAACAVAGVDLGQWQDGTVCGKYFRLTRAHST